MEIDHIGLDGGLLDVAVMGGEDRIAPVLMGSSMLAQRLSVRDRLSSPHCCMHLLLE